MKILVLSCDKNQDTFEPFHHCMEKYWPDHPEVIYSTETIGNPYYKTICINYPLEKWTNRIKRTLDVIDDNKILVMVDDRFIRKPVDIERINYSCEILSGNIACINYEQSFDKKDINTNFIQFKKRTHGSEYEVSIMCGLWDRDKLKDVLGSARTPWSVELDPKPCGYDFYINSGDLIIDWGYRTFTYAGIIKGKWCREVVPFFEKEGIKINYKLRGFYGK